MGLDQIDQFMNALGQVESGGNYAAQGPRIQSGTYAGERASGKYQIMPGNWESWSRAAGLEGADIRDPRAQDAVARHVMAGYYREFGNWDLVAVAWFAGAGAARRAARDGLQSLSSTTDRQVDANGRVIHEGATVPGYVSRIRANMGAPMDSVEAAAARSQASGRLDSVFTPQPPQSAPERLEARETADRTLRMLSKFVRANPGSGAHSAINKAFGLDRAKEER